MNLEATQRQPVARLTREISIILIGTILLTLSAKIAVPFYPVPMSTQTLVVLGLGLFLGPVLSLYLNGSESGLNLSHKINGDLYP